MRRRFVLLAAAIAACSPGERGGSGSVGDTGGTLLIMLPATPGTLMPPKIQMAQEKQIVEQVFDVLAEIGPDLNTFGDAGFTPRLARSWTWAPDSLSIAFEIDPAARWHDGLPVTAEDVRFSLELHKDPAVASTQATQLEIVDSIAVRDSLTAVAWFARRGPEQFYNLAYNLNVLPRHLLLDADRSNLRSSEFGRNPIGSGPFRFVRWDSRNVIEVAANENYHLGRPRLNRVIWQLSADLTSALTSVIAGEGDLLETVTPDGMVRIASSEAAKAVAFRTVTYSYLGFNLRDPDDPSRPNAIFQEQGVRRAIAMALDRRGMLANALDTLAVLGTGPFSSSYPTADASLPALPHDPAGAERLLDSLGWTRTGDGVRSRGGRDLQFSLLIPSTSASRTQYAELIQAQLRPLGIRVDIRAEDSGYGASLVGGRFDAMIMAWHVDPSPAVIRNTWYSRPPENRGFNLQAYSNPAFDATLDTASSILDPVQAREVYHRAYRILNDDRVAVWLFEPKVYVALHKRVRTVGENADSWWRYLRLWSIPAGERITRDN